ncbi:hypothetical protein [Brumimicrobium aurantiacum]|uniref:Uncharacterized protein n=1 Tax=Brumimicrobium aurantiacum TaxID=1737063 RepID=A0A3E1F1X0_9FLAO|nr:hypothetical protein [Brumimicrobium aurantiacum]RFC55818.1 hypothetical protein DXU93_02460 [Brumimicrobium aurantiacum]
MKEIRFIAALFSSLTLLSGFVFIGFIFYIDISSPLNIILTVFVLFLGIIASGLLFKMMLRRGVISVMSGTYASYDLDELEPNSTSNILKCKPKELVELFQVKKLEYARGLSVSIWGDQVGRKLDVKHTLKAISYDDSLETLTIIFSDFCRLKIVKPNLVLSTKSYLKVVKAKEIIWETNLNEEEGKFYHYKNNGKKIETASNTSWKPHCFDTGIGIQALYMQG